MGGIMFIIGIVCAIIIAVPFYYSSLSSAAGQGAAAVSGESHLQQVRLFGGLLMALAFAAVGFLDDYIKVVKKRNLGLRARQKILLQLLIGCAYLLSLYLAGETGYTEIPFVGRVELGAAYWPIALFVILGTVNAVNLTDGIDGLASSVTLFVAVFFMAIASVLQTFGMSIFAAAVAGGCIGFLLYNFYPAKVFMGDTGSLFLGGAVAGLAFAFDMPLVLVLVGIVYIVETLSDIIQVTYFKLTHGRRIFKMAPIHHHFELCGWGENKIVVAFTAVSAVFCALAYFGVMGRYIG